MFMLSFYRDKKYHNRQVFLFFSENNHFLTPFLSLYVHFCRSIAICSIFITNFSIWILEENFSKKPLYSLAVQAYGVPYPNLSKKH